MLEHLAELRTRLLRILVILLILAILSFFYIKDWFETIFIAPKNLDFVSYQLFNSGMQFLGFNPVFIKNINFNLQNVAMTGQFASHIHLALMAALVVSLPYIFWEAWGFLKPALHPHERKYTKNIVFYSSILLLIGVCFGYFIVTPLSVQFFGTYQISDAIENNIYLSSYLEMVVKTTFYTGILFQLPIFIYLLTKIELVNAELLRKYRRHAFLGILLIAALLTPPDFITQIIVGIPLFFLYELSIWVSVMAGKGRVE